MATTATPTPEAIFGTALAYQQSFALKTAVDLDLFTAIGEGAETVPAIAARVKASERGVRILCDFLTVAELLHKSGDRYRLAPSSAAFLDKRSPAYMGSITDFLVTPDHMRNFADLTATVRRGTIAPQANTVAGHEQDHWVTFARAMTPMMMPAAMGIADVLNIATAGPVKILDIAAGHGIFGVVLAQRNPRAQVVALDWEGVLKVASENAGKMGVSERVRPLAGDAFDVDYGSGYDIVLLTNFLHHYDPPTCTTLLRKVAAALKAGGRAVILEFVPNEDRVSPPMPASFSLTMLSATPAGDAYTLPEIRRMCADAGFAGGVTAHPLSMPETVVIATK